MTGRAPQAPADIEERIELLRTTLGLFAPGEPEPIARELCELGEDILVHWLRSRGLAPAAGLSLGGLADEAVRRDGGLVAARDICREMLRLADHIGGADDPETVTRLVALATAAGELYALVAPGIRGLA